MSRSSVVLNNPPLPPGHTCEACSGANALGQKIDASLVAHVLLCICSGSLSVTERTTPTDTGCIKAETVLSEAGGSTRETGLHGGEESSSHVMLRALKPEHIIREAGLPRLHNRTAVVEVQHGQHTVRRRQQHPRRLGRPHARRPRRRCCGRCGCLTTTRPQTRPGRPCPRGRCRSCQTCGRPRRPRTLPHMSACMLRRPPGLCCFVTCTRAGRRLGLRRLATRAAGRAQCAMHKPTRSTPVMV